MRTQPVQLTIVLLLTCVVSSRSETQERKSSSTGSSVEIKTFAIPQGTPTEVVRPGPRLNGPGADVVATVSEQHSLNSGSGIWTYTYTVTNAANSPRGLWSFTLRPIPSPLSITAPQGWEAQHGFQQPDQLNWFCVDPGPNPPDNNGDVAPSPFDIAPGTAGIFTFTTPVPPLTNGATFFVQGFNTIPISQDDESDADALLDGAQFFLDDSFTGTVDGPGSPIGVEPELPRPGSFVESSAPNPLAGGTANVTLVVDHPARVVLNLYDAKGRMVRMLFNGQLPAGTHVVVWNNGSPNVTSLASGRYFYRLQVDGRAADSRAITVVE